MGTPISRAQDISSLIHNRLIVRIGSQIPACGSLDDEHRALSCPQCLAAYAARRRISRRRPTPQTRVRRGERPLCNRPWDHDPFDCPDCRIVARTAPRVPRCGSTDPLHRARRCGACRRAAVAAWTDRRDQATPSDERARERARRSALRAKAPQPCRICRWPETLPISIELPRAAPLKRGRPRKEPGSTVYAWACFAHEREVLRALYDEHTDQLRPELETQPAPSDPYERLAIGLLADEPAAVRSWICDHARRAGGAYGTTLYALVRQWRALDPATQHRQRQALADGSST